MSERLRSCHGLGLLSGAREEGEGIPADARDGLDVEVQLVSGRCHDALLRQHSKAEVLVIRQGEQLGDRPGAG